MRTHLCSTASSYYNRNYFRYVGSRDLLILIEVLQSFISCIYVYRKTVKRGIKFQQFLLKYLICCEMINIVNISNLADTTDYKLIN